MDDKVLKRLVETELEWEPSIDATDIGVSVEKGVVTLSGFVRSYAEKVQAERTTQKVRDVRGVAIQLEVRRPGDASTTDDQIARRCLDSLDWNSSLPRGAVKVKVEDGRVTLSGELDWQYQRDAAESTVRRLHGVIAVANQITLRRRVAPSDVKSRIEAALERQARIDAGNVRVSVDGGKVRLEGKVNAWADRAIIERAAWNAPGVIAVEDRIAVA
ncbi:MAG: BON domain-containing protein [Brevundimonas sp.]